jgi:hypothetical protein
MKNAMPQHHSIRLWAGDVAQFAKRTYYILKPLIALILYTSQRIARLLLARADEFNQGAPLFLLLTFFPLWVGVV